MKTRGWAWVLLAYPAAATVGALLVTAGFVAISAYASLNSGGDLNELRRGLWVVPVAAIYAFCIFLAGLAVVGTPTWLVLARAGRRSRRHAVGAGVLLSVLTGAAVLLAAGEPATAWEPWIFAASLSVPGAAAGWTLHRIAYGR